MEENVTALLTWMKKCIYAHFPRSHETSNLLQISSSNDILEDDVIGEVYSPLGRHHRYDRCRGLLRLFALSWSAAQGFAVSRAVRGRSFVGGRVMGRGVIRSAVLCRGVLWYCSVCGRRGCVVWRAVVRRCVVRWGVLGAPCVWCQRYVVVVLHLCSFVSSFHSEIRRRNPDEQNNPMTQQYPLSFSVFGSLYPLRFQNFNNSSFLTHSFVLLIVHVSFQNK